MVSVSVAGECSSIKACVADSKTSGFSNSKKQEGAVAVPCQTVSGSVLCGDGAGLWCQSTVRETGVGSVCGETSLADGWFFGGFGFWLRWSFFCGRLGGGRDVVGGAWCGEAGFAIGFTLSALGGAAELTGSHRHKIGLLKGNLADAICPLVCGFDFALEE